MRKSYACYICRINAGDATVLVATRNIAKGEEIADIYSMHYSENTTKQGLGC